jgi:hypothetical protein
MNKRLSALVSRNSNAILSTGEVLEAENRMDEVTKYCRATELHFDKHIPFANRLVRAGNTKWAARVRRRSAEIWERRHRAAGKQLGPLPAFPLR